MFVDDLKDGPYDRREEKTHVIDKISRERSDRLLIDGLDGAAPHEGVHH